MSLHNRTYRRLDEGSRFLGPFTFLQCLTLIADGAATFLTVKVLLGLPLGVAVVCTSSFVCAPGVAMSAIESSRPPVGKMIRWLVLWRIGPRVYKPGAGKVRPMTLVPDKRNAAGAAPVQQPARKQRRATRKPAAATKGRAR